MSSVDHGSGRRLFGRLAVALALVVGVTLGSLGAIDGGPAGAVGPATQLAFTTNPSTVVAGATMTAPVVQLRDSGNNNVLQAGVTVTMSLGVGSFDPSSTTSVVRNSLRPGGLLQFRTPDTTGSFTMTAASTGLTSKTSGSFTVNPGATEQVALSSVPSTVTSGAALGIVVTAEDAYGNKESSLSTGSVTLSVATGPAGGALAGTVTRTFSGGVVDLQRRIADHGRVLRDHRLLHRPGGRITHGHDRFDCCHSWCGQKARIRATGPVNHDSR